MGFYLTVGISVFYLLGEIAESRKPKFELPMNRE
jgi:hypothetical protein